MSNVRYEIVFTGRVQGVGFRYTTVRVAQGFDLTGWVRNEPDGSVRCVIEGEKSELDRFLQGVKHAMSVYIAEARVTESPAQGSLQGFSIQRH